MTDEFDKLKENYNSYTMSEKDVERMKDRINQAKSENRVAKRMRHFRGWAVAAAAALTIFILPNANADVANAMGNIPGLGSFFQLITVRDYHHDDGRNEADVDVSGLEATGRKGRKTAEEINNQIKQLTDRYVAEFKDSEKYRGHEGLSVGTEIIDRTDDYFTLKLSSLETAGDSYQENHYYTISLKTGKQIKLADLFRKGTDYRSVLKDNVKQQMIKLMKSDDNNYYFIADDASTQKEIGFSEDDLVKDASFYLNKKGNIVICYNQGDVAPMYMGAQEFVIPESAVKDILK